MVRPQSIVTFERCYLTAWALGLVNTIVTWRAVQSDPDVMAAAAQVGDWYMPTISAIGLAIPLVLWFFVARRGSVVAKWIMVVCTALGLAGLAFSAATGRFPSGLAAGLSIAAIALNVYAATRLFRPDTRAWFGEAPVHDA